MVQRGVSLSQLAKNLQDKQLVTNSTWFQIWVRLQKQHRYIKAGTYQFQGNTSPQKIIEKLINGSTYNEIALEFTIPEGFTLKQINERLENLHLENLTKLHRISHNPDFISQLGIEAPSLEGFLYPAKYTFFNKIPSAKKVYRKMAKEFFSRLPPGYHKRCSEHNLSLFQAITFASLIEKETLLKHEMPMVSEVIWNRLNKRIKLGIDAAIIYGIKNFDGNLTFKHLKDASNPYNTRVHYGLPPGPIGAPSLHALNAVFNPTTHGNFYYVLLPGPDSKHHFSKTLNEHNRYVKKLVKAQKKSRFQNKKSNIK